MNKPRSNSNIHPMSKAILATRGNHERRKHQCHEAYQQVAAYDGVDAVVLVVVVVVAVVVVAAATIAAAVVVVMQLQLQLPVQGEVQAL